LVKWHLNAVLNNNLKVQIALLTPWHVDKLNKALQSVTVYWEGNCLVFSIK